MSRCKVCQEEIHPRRVALGFKTTCIKHSTAERYTGIISATGKTDYALNIIKDPELAKQLKELSPVYQ